MAALAAFVTEFFGLLQSGRRGFGGETANSSSQPPAHLLPLGALPAVAKMRWPDSLGLYFGDSFATLDRMKTNWIEREGQVIDLPSFSSVIEKDGAWFVAHCPELGVASQGETRTAAHRMLGEAVELWLEAASAAEIKRRLKRGARVRPLTLQHA